MQVLRRLGFPLFAIAVIGAATWSGLRSGDDPPPAPTPAPPVAASPPATTAEPAEPESARQLFAHQCSTCHTLRAAGSSGGIGPDLDAVAPTARHVLRMIRTGSLDSSMPADLLVGDDARRVARYVARVAGR